jgi:hypothetical protein
MKYKERDDEWNANAHPFILKITPLAV